ncbi:MAG: ATP-binding protein [Rhodococcus sp. (in: high G+C Gram-positive bacteria)]
MIADYADGQPATDDATDASTDLVMDGIPAEAWRLTPIRTAVLSWLRDHGMNEDTSQDITLATYEALANGVEHAYGTSSAGGDKVVGLVVHTPGDGSVTVRVTDRGRWVDGIDDPRRGRGLPLIHALADEASIESTNTGTVVTMQWRR